MASVDIAARDGEVAFSVGPNGTTPGVRITTYLPLGEGSLSVPLDEDQAQEMALAILAMAPDNEDA